MHFSARSPVLLLAAVLALAAGTARAQPVVVHDGFATDDGHPARDADGVTNGVVVWAGGGTVHIVRRGIEVRNGQRLEIRPGAVVKFAHSVALDGLGMVISAEPTKDGYLRTAFDAFDTDQRRPVIVIDRAVLTDIRDDVHGGDTNRDGAATWPEWLAFGLSFAESPSRMEGSTLRFGWMERAGFALVRRSRFEQFGGVCPRASFEDVGAAPVFQDNIIELAFPAGCSSLDFRGASVLFTGNTVRPVPFTTYQGELQADALVIGPCCTFDPKGPLTGTTVIADNTLEGRSGILMPWQAGTTMYRATEFRAVIEGNTIEGATRPVGSTVGDVGLDLVLDAGIRVERNRITRFERPLVLQAAGTVPVARPVLRDNVFEGTGADPFLGPSVPDAWWRVDRILDARHNGWGHATGPVDESGADGLANSRGLGIRLGNGIDYAPFRTDPDADRVRVRIRATSVVDPVPAGLPVTIDPALSRLEAQGPGTAVVIVRDDEGFPIATSVPIPVADASSALRPVTVDVPTSTRFLAVEVLFTGQGGGSVLRSNRVWLPVARSEPRLALRVLSHDSTNPLWPVEGPARGVTASFTAVVDYELPTASAGRIEFDVDEVDLLTGQVLDTPVFTPGTVRIRDPFRGRVQTAFTIRPPLRDVLVDDRPSALRLRLRLRDGADAVVAEETFRLAIHDASNRVRILSVEPGRFDGAAFAASGFRSYVAGERADARLTYRAEAGSPNAPHLWQVLRESSAVDATGRVLARWTPVTPLENLFTAGRVTETVALQHDSAIPVGAAAVRHVLRLWSPYYRVNLAVDTLVVDVRAPAPSETIALPTDGSMRLAFTGVPVTLDWTARPPSGTVGVREVDGPWTLPASAPYADGSLPPGFVPIGRRWAVATAGNGAWEGRIAFGLDPARDLADFGSGDAVAIGAWNPLSGRVELLETRPEAESATFSAPFDRFFELWVPGIRRGGSVATERPDPAVGYSLDVPWPNPFRADVRIPFRVEKTGRVRITVADALGRGIAVLVDDTLPPGTHEARWDASGVASGAYWLRMEAGGTVRSRPVVRIR